MTTAAEQDLVYRIVELERSLGAHRQWHSEELDELERRLAELKREVPTLHCSRQIHTETEEGDERDVTTEEPEKRDPSDPEGEDQGGQ